MTIYLCDKNPLTVIALFTLNKELAISGITGSPAL